MAEEHSTKLSREQLYNEIWEISVSGVAKKYNVKYSELLQLCKDNNIPIPPSGYWTKLSYGKPVTQIPLPEMPTIEIELHADYTPRRSRSKAAIAGNTVVLEDTHKVESSDYAVQVNDSLEISGKQPSNESSEVLQEDQILYQTVSGKYNTYNREKLYEEVWSKPVVEVALQYGVSDVAIHKICKSLNVPVPPRGYWAKIRAGEKLERPLLPKTNGVTEITGTRTFEGIKVSGSPSQPLEFLAEGERQKVLLAAQQIKMPDENAKLHKKIVFYKSVVKEWNKKNMRPEGTQKGFNNYSYSNRPPFLAGVISEETLPRVYRILDALFRQVEVLGGSVNDDLSLQIRNERVELEVTEAQDEIKHVITKQEAQALLVYEDAKRHHSWASEPQIRKYDYIFNGHLRIAIREHRYFRDTDKVNIESRLGEMMIELYEESQVVRKNREAYEEEQRKKEEEKRLREDRRVRYNEEVDKTIALTNMAQDYDIACKIRAYINALEPRADMTDEKTAEWIDWAKKKADWFDPSVARTDEILGDRDHEESEDRKSLKKRYY